MLKDSEAENLLVIDRYRSLVGFYDQNVISLDDVAAESKDFALSVELTAPKPENLAYMTLHLRFHRKTKRCYA